MACFPRIRYKPRHRDPARAASSRSAASISDASGQHYCDHETPRREATDTVRAILALRDQHRELIQHSSRVHGLRLFDLLFERPS